MIEAKLDNLTQDDLRKLDGQMWEAMWHLKEEHKDREWYPEIKDLLDALVEDIKSAHMEKSFGGLGPHVPTLKDWRSFTVENYGDEERVDAEGNRVWPEGDTP
jgi:hypothetical protein